MNWQVKPAGPLALLVALIGLGACQEPSDLETNVGPDTDRIGVNYVELSLNPQLTLLDSIYTTNSGTLLVGRYEDDELGVIEGTGYTRLRLSELNPVIKPDAQVDSVVLVMFNRSLLSKSPIRQNQEFQVYQLRQFVEGSEPYYTTSERNLEKLLGVGATSTDRDTTLYHRITLDADSTFGNSFLIRMKNGDDVFSSSNNFQGYYPGIAIMPGDNNAVMMGIDVSTDSSKMIMYYSSPGDTTSIEYVFHLNRGRSFTSLDVDRTGTILEEMSDPYTLYDGQGRSFTMGGVGLGTVLDIDELRSYFDTIPNKVLNYAEIVVGGLEDTDDAIQPTTLDFYLVDEDLQFKGAVVDTGEVSIINPPKAIQSILAPVEAPTLGDVSYFNPFFDEVTKSYSGPLTTFVQAVLSGVIDEKYILILPKGYTSNIQHTKQDTEDIKLRLYYSIPNL